MRANSLFLGLHWFQVCSAHTILSLFMFYSPHSPQHPANFSSSFALDFIPCTTSKRLLFPHLLNISFLRFELGL